MDEVEVFYDDDSDPESLDAEEVIIGKDEYILRQFGGDQVIIPRCNVRKINIEGADVIRED